MNHKEFEKPVVPQYVADWYEENKDNFENNLAYLINDYLNRDFAFIADSNLKEWLDKDFNLNKPIQTLVKMKLFGYKVEKKLYTVEIPNPNGDKYSKSYDDGYKGYTKTYLGKNEDGKVELFTWRFELRKESDYWKRKEDAQLTEKEIKEDYAWAWDLGFAKEVTD